MQDKLHSYVITESDVVSQAVFPMEGFFQMHFEHLQKQLQQALNALDVLQTQVECLERTLPDAQKQRDRLRQSWDAAGYR